MSLTRRYQILKLIVEDFIQTATPVASKYLIKKYDLPYSSATVRNEMAALENEGLLEKTHTSSGRVPSAKGYKYYASNLKSNKVDTKFKNELKKIFDSQKSINEVLRESCAILSHMTDLTSVILGPKVTEESLVKIQVVPLDNKTCTVIFITNTGYVENRTFVITDKNEMKDIVNCINLLDERLKGTKIYNLTEKLVNMKPLLENYLNDYSNLYNSLLRIFIDFASNRSVVIGKENLINQPEFSDNAERLKKLFGLFENPIKLEEIINNANDLLLIEEDGKSNEENISSTIKEDVSIVAKDVVLPNDEVLGKIAVIGPKRMDYSKVINYINYVVNEIITHMKK